MATDTNTGTGAGGGTSTGTNTSQDGPGGPKYPCTSYGNQQMTTALQALQDGHDITQVARYLTMSEPADYKTLPGDTACVYYADGPYIGCREFYMTGPADGSFTPANYQSHPELWSAVSRCDAGCTDPNGCMP